MSDADRHPPDLLELLQRAQVALEHTAAHARQVSKSGDAGLTGLIERIERRHEAYRRRVAEAAKPSHETHAADVHTALDDLAAGLGEAYLHLNG